MKRISALVAATLLSAMPSHAVLTTNTYISPGSTPWDFAPAWSAGVPAIGNAAVIITNAMTKFVGIVDATLASSLTISNLGIFGPVGTLNTLAVMTTNTFTVLQNIGIGPGAALTVSNATLDVKGLGGGFVTDDGTITLSGNANFVATNALSGVDIGHGGSGVLTMSSGRLLVIDEEVATFPGDKGTLTLAGGTNIVTTDGLFIGESAGATGFVWVTGGSLVETNATIFDGNLGFGVIIVSNGFVRAGDIKLANAPGATGGMNLVGGTNVVTSSLLLGNYACSATGIVGVAGGKLSVTNGTGSAVLEVRSGSVSVSSGIAVIDNLVMTNACGHFTHTGGALSITTTNLGAALDADGDGMPNSFEQSNGLDPFNSADASADPDGDGFTNLQEFQAGTNPNDASSTPFAITSIAKQGNDVLLTWTTFKFRFRRPTRHPSLNRAASCCWALA